MNQELSLTPEEMRSLGYKVIDMLVDHFESLPQKPVTRKSSPKDLGQLLCGSLPKRGMDMDDLLHHVQRDVFENIMHLDHPRFFAFVSSPSNFISVIGGYTRLRV